MTGIYTLYIVAVIFLMLQLRKNHCFFNERENIREATWLAIIWILSFVSALICSFLFPIIEKNHKEVLTHRIEKGDDRYEGVILTDGRIKFRKVDKFCKRAVIYEDYSFFGVKLAENYRFEY